MRWSIVNGKSSFFAFSPKSAMDAESVSSGYSLTTHLSAESANEPLMMLTSLD